MKTGATRWAEEEFGATSLGDVRRTRRLVAMALGAARRPSGKISVVFDRQHEREGAYDFLESPHVDAGVVARSMFDATAARAEGEKWVYVAIDGSALSLTDETGNKGFGPVGSPNVPAAGLKVMNALAVSRSGVPLGLIDQVFWNRPPPHGLGRREQTERNQRRPFETKETAHFVRAARAAAERLERAGTRAWVLIDREADNRDIIRGLLETDCAFTVRATWNRKLAGTAARLHTALDHEPSLGTYEVVVRRRHHPPRIARVDVRATQVTLAFRKHHARRAGAARLYAVRLREVDPITADAVDLLLYTNVPVFSVEHAKHIVATYEMRWRVEEFHKTWKQGHCNVEHAQLHSINGVRLWATILAAVATRIERLKHLAREQPNAEASIEFSADEIEALRLDQQRRWPDRKVPAMPSIAQATIYLGEIGGWIRKPNTMPGSIILARALERLSLLLDGIALARQPSRGVRRT